MIFSVNVATEDLVIFTEEIFNEKLHFSWSDCIIEHLKLPEVNLRNTVIMDVIPLLYSILPDTLLLYKGENWNQL